MSGNQEYRIENMYFSLQGQSKQEKVTRKNNDECAAENGDGHTSENENEYSTENEDEYTAENGDEYTAENEEPEEDCQVSATRITVIETTFDKPRKSSFRAKNGIRR